jgi:hypothetical protein
MLSGIAPPCRLRPHRLELRQLSLGEFEVGVMLDEQPKARRGHRANCRPAPVGSSFRIKQSHRTCSPRKAYTPCDQNLSVREQSGRMTRNGQGKRSGRCPSAADWIVQFRTVENTADSGATGDQYFSSLKKNGRMSITTNVHRAGRCKGP